MDITLDSLSLTEQPLISIITACYNSEKFIENFLNSIALQTYPNYELIIVDGASTDNTLRIVDKYMDVLNITLISEKDSGVYDAWNKGLNLVRGEWITFIGSDDVLLPDAFERYIAYLNKLQDKTINYISSKVEIISNDGRLIRLLGWKWEWQISRKVCNIAHTGSLHHKTLFKTYGRFSTQYKVCGDYEFLLRAGENLKAAFMDEVTLKMYLGGLSDTSVVIKESCVLLYNLGIISKVEMYALLLFRYIKFIVRKALILFHLDDLLKYK